ncbi:MAG: hypothetical protein JM58_13225 [Peptococcaceae bacterium BICA1-8]|nr:MAG: hypothetical protein JM58_13225 [Peptococcaceae bacterium BICA1-8]
MFKTKKLILLLAVTLLVTMILGLACTPQRSPAPAPRDNNLGAGDTRMEDRDLDERRAEDNNEAQKKAEKMAEKIVDEVQGINSATVVFAEEIVYVGIDLHADYTGNEAENVKKEVARIVKEDDPDIETVYVTEDADTFTRLQRIGRDIENGRPISGFLDELQNMFRRVTPSME